MILCGSMSMPLIWWIPTLSWQLTRLVLSSEQLWHAFVSEKLIQMNLMSMEKAAAGSIMATSMLTLHYHITQTLQWFLM